MIKKVKTLTIVGGGSSAWLTAAYLSNQCKNLEITVIDKKIGTPIGVGEGTLLNFSRFMEDCGFHISEWFDNIDATYKAGAFFPGWKHKDHQIWHPFLMSPKIEGDICLQNVWSRNQSLDFKKHALCLFENSVFYNKVDSSVIESYAYHIDCSKLVIFIQNALKQRIQFIASDVVQVNYDDNGISSLNLENGTVVNSDLYIDCTGFNNLLNKYADRTELLGRVFCDTAVCSQIEYRDKDTEMRPYTRAEAVDHGWIWTIPTKSRMGSGIIFNKNITDPEEAKDFLVNYWGKDRLDRNKLRTIDWTPFYLKNVWSKNVVSVGMSAGFIEPLESTGLALVQYQVFSLANIIKSGFFNEANVNHYNLEFVAKFEDCVDFVSMHYDKTLRTEKFWNYVKETYQPNENILLRAEMLKEKPMSATSYQDFQIFTGTNWTTWMTQLGFSVGEDTSISKDLAAFLLEKYFNTVEQYRPNWSQHHATEISRSTQYHHYEKEKLKYYATR
jgi:tryptophan halogenase